MESKEFGLVAAQQLFQIQDLHYGFWEKGEIPTTGKLIEAQEKYTKFLARYVEEAINADKNCKILDIGCGIGITTRKFLEMGYRVDALVPSAWMAQKARTNVEQYADNTKGNIFECGIEDFPVSDLDEKYQLAYFSESFQYVNMQKAFDVLNKILSDNGTVIIFDFFRKDDVEGKSPMGGGHLISKFYETVDRNGFTIQTDLDVTENLSPNMKLVNDILVNRVIPFGNTLDAFLSSRYNLVYRFIKFLLKRKLADIEFKYSQRRNAESFEKFKTYRMLVLKKI